MKSSWTNYISCNDVHWDLYKDWYKLNYPMQVMQLHKSPQVDDCRELTTVISFAYGMWIDNKYIKLVYIPYISRKHEWLNDPGSIPVWELLHAYKKSKISGLVEIFSLLLYFLLMHNSKYNRICEECFFLSTSKFSLKTC